MIELFRLGLMVNECPIRPVAPLGAQIQLTKDRCRSSRMFSGKFSAEAVIRLRDLTRFLSAALRTLVA